MAENVQPRDAVVADISDAIREAIAGPWIKRWLDIRTFLAQRRALLRDSTLALDSEIRTSVAGWKTPAKFAIQGLILPAVIIQVLNLLLALILVRPTPYIDRLRSEADAALASVRENRALVAGMPPSAILVPVRDLRTRPSVSTDATGISQPEYLKLLARAEPTLVRGIKLIKTGQNIDAAEKLILPFAAPTAFVLAAFAFRLFARRTLISSANGDPRRAHEAFLYLHTSSLFWANVVMMLTASVAQNILIYSGEFDRAMYAASHQGPAAAVVTLFLFTQVQMIAVVLLAAPWLIVGWRRFVREMRHAYGLAPAGIWRDRLLGAAYGANLVTFIMLTIALNLVTSVYGYVATAIEERRISLDYTRPSP